MHHLLDLDIAALRRARRRTAHLGPPAGIGHAEQRRAPPGPKPRAGGGAAAARSRRHQQHPQAGETIGVGEAKGNQFAQRIFRLGGQQAQALGNLVEERRAVVTDEIRHRPSPR